MSGGGTTAAGGPGRYQRSPSGLVAALLVVVLAIGGILLYRNLFSSDYEDRPPDYDYLATVSEVQSAGFPAVYPPALPEGWVARNVAFEPGDRPSLALSLLTDDERFVGVRQADESADDLVSDYVDENADEGEPYRAEASVARTWDTWTDEGGDTAYAARVGDTTVLVFGSVSADVLAGVVESLTDAPVDPGQLPESPVTPSSSR